MAYTAKTWATNEVITSTALNHIEDGIQDVSDGDIATVYQSDPSQNIVMRFAASDEARKTQAGPWHTNGAGFVSVASASVPLGYALAGTVRVIYDLWRSSSSSSAVRGQIKVNGAVVSGPTAINSQTPVAVSDDIDVSPGDIITLEIDDSSEVEANAANFILAATDIMTAIYRDAPW